MENLNRYIPKVQKRTLLLVASIVWMFAGFRVFTIGLEDIHFNKGNGMVILIFASLTFIVFFRFIFMKLVKKHTVRIVNSELDKQYIYSFFDLRSYLIMGFMMFMGIYVRSLGVFNPYYLGIFYTGLGLALFISGVSFLIKSLNFNITKVKYSN